MSNAQVEIPTNLNSLFRDISKTCTEEQETMIMADLKRVIDSESDNLYGALSNLYKKGVIDENDDEHYGLTCLQSIMEKVENKQSSMLIQEYERSQLPSKGDQLIGRQRDIDKLKENLSDHNVHGINLFGPSGVGKTRLVREIATKKLEFSDQDISTFLVELTAITTMSNLYSSLLYEFKLITYATKNDQEQRMQSAISSISVTERNRIIKFLEHLTSKTLLILDNIEQELIQSDEEDEFEEFINAILHSRVIQDGTLKVILISTDRINFQKDFKSIKAQCVSPLPKEISNEFITKRSKVYMSEESEDQALNKIANYCRHLPYLLKIAEEMMRKDFCTPREVLQEIESQIGKGVHKEYACIRASFESISSDHLKKLAVKLSILRCPFSVSTVMKIAEIPLDYYATIDLELLAKQKIITRVEREKKYDEMKKEKKWKYEVHSLFHEFVTSSLVPGVPIYKEIYKRTEKMFAQHFSCKMNALAKNLEKDFVQTFIKMEKNRVNIDLTLDLTSTNKEIIEQLLPSQDHEAACRLVLLLEALKDFNERRKLLKTWADTFEQEEKWLISANMRCWQAIQLADMEGTKNPERILQEAKACLDKAAKATDPPSDPDQLQAGNALFQFCRGKILYMKGANSDEKKINRKLINDALHELEASLVIYKYLYGNHTTMSVRALNLQGNCFMELDDPDKAEKVYTEALEMKIKLTRTEKHCEIATLYNQLSQVHDKRGTKEERKWYSWLPPVRRSIKQEYEEAVRWLQKALDLDRELNLNDILSSATLNRNLANVLLALERYDEALAHAEESYTLRKELLGKHPETVRILFLIGTIHEWRKKKENALESYEEAFIIEESLPQDNHSVVRFRLCDRFKKMCEKCNKEKLQNYKQRISQVQQIKQSSSTLDDTRSRLLDDASEKMESYQEISSEMSTISVSTYGGTYNLLSQGLFLDFPPGAVDKPTEITVELLNKNSLPSPSGDMETVVSFIVKIGPCDVVLQKPIVVELVHSGCVGLGHFENRAIAFNESIRTWREIPEQHTLHPPIKSYETELIQVQLAKLTTLTVVSRLITDTFEVPVGGCCVRSSVHPGIRLEFPEGAVDRTINGSLKVLPMPDAIPKDINACPSPIVIVNIFPNVMFSKPVTMRLPHPCPAKYTSGELHLMHLEDGAGARGGKWKENTETVCYTKHDSTIELQINHFSWIWLLVGVTISASALTAYQQLTGIPQVVCFVAFCGPDSVDANTGVIKLTLLCMANHMNDRTVQRMRETFGEDFIQLAQATGKKTMLPNETVYIAVEDGNFMSRNEVQLQFLGDDICAKELVIEKKKEQGKMSWFFINLLKKDSDKTDILGQLIIDECRFRNLKRRRSGVPPSTTVPPLMNYRSIEDPDSEEVYSVESIPKGILVIIENETFRSERPLLEHRAGSEKDVEALSNVFCRYLDFKMKYIRNQNKWDLLTKLRKILEDPNDRVSDCCVISAMSHGVNGCFYDINGKEVKVSQIQSIVKELFVGKPKLIFVQACRTKGPEPKNRPKQSVTHNFSPPVSTVETTSEDLSSSQVTHNFSTPVSTVETTSEDLSSSQVTHNFSTPVSTMAQTTSEDLSSSQVTHNFSTPVSTMETTSEDLSSGESNSSQTSPTDDKIKEADILTAYACCEGSEASRYPERGSLFIQTLAKTFEEKADCMDVLSMLTEVNNDVFEKSRFIQPCEIVSRLTKKLYFWPKKTS